MLCCPTRFPFNLSRRFAGGDSRSFRSIALSIMVSFRSAAFLKPKNSLTIRPEKKLSVFLSRKLLITVKLSHCTVYVICTIYQIPIYPRQQNDVRSDAIYTRVLQVPLVAPHLVTLWSCWAHLVTFVTGLSSYPIDFPYHPDALKRLVSTVRFCPSAPHPSQRKSGFSVRRPTSPAQLLIVAALPEQEGKVICI